MKQFDAEEVRKRIQQIKRKIGELAQDASQLNRELYLMGLLTPLLDELGADPAVIVGGHGAGRFG